MKSDDEQKKFLRLSAELEGHEVVLAGIGKKAEMSEMEIICLANFAEIWMLFMFTALDGPDGEEAEKSLDDHLDKIRRRFGGNGADGLTKLSASAGALLRGKLFKYIV